MNHSLLVIERLEVEPRRSTLLVRSGRITAPETRARQLTRQVYEIIAELNRSVERADDSFVLDFRVDASKGDAEWPNALTFLHAVRGLVQSLTLELPAPAPAFNVVVSTDAEQTDRDRTIRYLHSLEGSFSRGTTYDLRGAR